MLIMNQTKTKFINFDRIECCFVNGNNQRPSRYSVSAYLVDGGRETLGEYGTSKEKALKVLQEIFERYANWQNLKYGQPTGICLPIYQIPKEEEV